MSRPSIKIIGKLRYSPDTGLEFSTTVDDGKTFWLDVFLGRGDIRQAQEFRERQRQHPQRIGGTRAWAYKDLVVVLTSDEPDTVLEEETRSLLVKRYVLRRERQHEKIRRETETLENVIALGGAPREAIPDAIRLFVWQRDGGRCVRCGSRKRLEFDHVIPLSVGGSSTERNLQLLCESCNRAKGSSI